MKAILTTLFLSLFMILSLASQCPSGANNPPGSTSSSSTSSGLTNTQPTNPGPTGPVPTNPAPTGPAPGPAPTNPAPTGPAPTGPAPTGPEPTTTQPTPTGNFDEHINITYKTQQYCNDMGFFWSENQCLTFHAAKQHCDSTKEGPLNHPYSVKGALHCGGLQDADENCRKENKITYNQHTGHCEGEVVIDNQARTHKDYCLKSGYHWVDHYKGNNKCFTAKEFDAYSIYKDFDSCTQNGHFWFKFGVWPFSEDFCATLDKSRDTCMDRFGSKQPYPYAGRPSQGVLGGHVHTVCGTLEQAEDYCKRKEGGKKYNPANGHCEEDLTFADPPRTPRDHCLKSGHHWVSSYEGKNKCFTAQEFNVYSTYKDKDSCARNGHFWQGGVGSWGIGYAFCAPFSKSAEHCKEMKGRPYVWFNRQLGIAHCGDLKDAERYCNTREGGKKYNPTNGHCE